MSQEKLLQSLAILESLKSNVPEQSIKERYVREFNENLMEIEQILNIDLSKFKIDTKDVKPRVISYDPYRGKRYSEVKYCERELYLTKLDGAIVFISMLLKEPPKEMGFINKV